MTLFLVINAIHFLGYRETFAYLYVLYLPLLLSIAPAYFLYILSITRDNHDVEKKERLILFSPSILMFIANLVLIIFAGDTIKEALIKQDLWFKGNETGEMPSWYNPCLSSDHFCNWQSAENNDERSSTDAKAACPSGLSGMAMDNWYFNQCSDIYCDKFSCRAYTSIESNWHSGNLQFSYAACRRIHRLPGYETGHFAQPGGEA
jgi:hypothetical protein